MPHYKDSQNKVYFLDDSQNSNLLPVGSVQITDAQADAIRSPPKTPAQLAVEVSALAKQQLEDIDMKSIRGLREYIAAKLDAPLLLKTYELDAQVERAKII